MTEVTEPSPPLSYREQLDLLKRRGLQVPDDAFALHCLANYNYYRLSIYWRQFTVEGNHDQFETGASFDQIWQLYEFDCGLRQLVSEACKRVEVAARSRWAYELGHEYGAQAYEDPTVFSHKPNHTKLLAWFDQRFAESNEEFASHYKAKQCHRPEIWVAIELLEFGKFCSFYNNTKQVKIRERIAGHFDLNEPTFASLINTARHLRNICAHHSRLWNRKLTAKITPPKKHPAELIENVQHFPPSEDGQSRRIYNPLVLLIHCIRIIQPDSDWPKRLHNHLQTLPAELLPEMGFPKDWQQRPIWR